MADVVRDLSTTELAAPAGAAATTSKLVSLLLWSILSSDCADDLVSEAPDCSLSNLLKT